MRTTSTRRRALVGAFAVVLALVLSGCLDSGHQRLVYLVNRDRAGYGRPALSVDYQLVDKAKAWSYKMSRDGRISHSTLTSGVPGCWRSLGENVAVASSVDGLHRAWMASAPHRANILSWNYNRIGVGITKRDGRYYGVQVFMLC